MAYNSGIYGPLTEEALSVYGRLGIDAVFTDVKFGETGVVAIEKAKSYGFEVYACAWTFKAPTKEDKSEVVNVHGERGLWAGAGCPNNPEVRKHSLAWIKNALDLDVDGIVLDGVRFPSPGGGFPCF